MISQARAVPAVEPRGKHILSIEDQVAPKRCGHVAGKQIIPLEEAVGKFRGVADVRVKLDEDFVIYGRTDAIGSVDGGLDQAIRRAKRYSEAGADVIWVEGIRGMKQAERVADEVDASLMFNNLMSDAGVSQLIGRETLRELGYDITHFLGSLTPTMTAVYDYMDGLLEGGVEFDERFQERLEDHPVGDVHKFAGFNKVYGIESEYLQDEDQEKYKTSAGYDPTQED